MSLSIYDKPNILCLIVYKKSMNAIVFSNILNTLVITTIAIFAVSTGLIGYSSLKEKLATRR